MKLKQYQVDAFASKVFKGNPAAVCPLRQWLSDELMQSIAAENNLSETAFFVPSARGFHLRWFTPTLEIELCGHATLAAAHVLFEHLGYVQTSILFETLSGDLIVQKKGDLLLMDFPAITSQSMPIPSALVEALGVQPREVRIADIYIAVLDNEAQVLAIKPDMEKINQLELRAVVVTAKGDHVDFVSRYFAPRVGIPEDPVTGSAHCKLMPYWAEQFGRNRLSARQISARGGDVQCELVGDRVILAGNAVTFMEANIFTSEQMQ